MPFSKIVRYKVSFWTKGYNRGKVNILLTDEKGEATLVENLTTEEGSFLLALLENPGLLTCDPESPEGVVNLTTERLFDSE
jgi:hypothetical protein